MSLVAIIVSFTIFWLLCFMIILPINVEISEQIEKGHADSAPKEAYFFKKFLLSIVAATILTSIYIYVIVKYPQLAEIIKP